MAHDFLNDFDIPLVFTKPRTESMTQINHDAKQAYSALRKRGIDLRNTAEYTPSVQALLAEIYALAHENSRAKKAVVEAEETKAEEQVNNEAESQQE